MISGPAARLRAVAAASCTMAGEEIAPRDVIKILGCTLDPDLAWDAHAAVATSRAHGAVNSVCRAARHLSARDRGRLMVALAHPHLDYCQTAIAAPSHHAGDIFRRAYNHSARRAVRPWEPWCRSPRSLAGRQRTDPALARLRWPTWQRRCAARRAARVSQLWHAEEPVALCSALHEACGRPSDMVVGRRPLRALPQPRTQFGRKAFSLWAPQVLQAVLTNAVLADTPGIPRPPRPVRAARSVPPQADEHKLERDAFLAAVTEYYQWKGTEFTLRGDALAPESQSRPADELDVFTECIESRCFEALLPTLRLDPHDRVVVWGDGSATLSEGIAGGGVFYGQGSARNFCFRTRGAQTNQRSEACALLHCLQRDDRPLVFFTDSTYVHDGVSSWREKWRARAWFKHPLRAEYMAHADIWQQIDDHLRRRPRSHVVTCWSRGHPRPAHAAIGETTDFLCWGNGAADWLSKRGARLPLGGFAMVARFDIT